MIGRLAGFLLIVGGALTAVGAFPTWVTVAASGSSGSSTYTAFTAASDYRDAIVSFAIAAGLILIGFAMAVRPQLWSRTLACLAGIAAGMWAGLLFFTLAPQARDLIGPAPSTAMGAVDMGLGLWITAGGGALGLLGGVMALAARRPRAARTSAVAAPVYTAPQRPVAPAPAASTASAAVPARPQPPASAPQQPAGAAPPTPPDRR